MSVGISEAYTHREIRWTAWKVIQNLKNFVYQHDADAVRYTIWGYDGPEVNLCTIWRGAVPDSVIAEGYSQAQNDTDKSEWEADWLPESNQAIDAIEADGRKITTTYPALIDTLTQFVGSGDDIANSVENEGPVLEFSFATGTRVSPEVQTIDIQFLQNVQIADGEAKHSGTWDPRDKLSFGIRILANAPVVNMGNTGNCNLVPSGDGYNFIVPAAGNGTHDINLATAKPVIRDVHRNTGGSWWVNLRTGVIEAANSDGNAHLIDIEQIFWLVRYSPVGSASGLWDIDVYRAEFCHKNWLLRAQVKKTSDGAGVLAGSLLLYRILVPA